MSQRMLDVLLAVESSMLYVHSSFCKICLRKKADEKRSSDTVRPLHVRLRLCALPFSLLNVLGLLKYNLCTTKLTLWGEF